MGTHVKIPGEIEADPRTGQLTSIFAETPQVPIRGLKLSFKGRARGVIATPSRCGTYQTSFQFTPWAGLPTVSGQTPMTIDEGCGTGASRPASRLARRTLWPGRFPLSSPTSSRNRANRTWRGST
jgi:hypothetical protein